MIKVSVIISVYNVEKYLRKCLDSVINQTLKDIEIICVEDRSEDNSLDILREYADRDSRIKIYQNQKNSGLSYSRNVGIKNSAGKYIQFVDSDDFLEIDALETLYNISEKNSLDVLIFNARRFGNKSGDLITKEFPFENKILNGNEFNYYYVKENFHETVWLKFIRNSFIKENNLYFHEGIYHEDVPYSFSLFYYANRCMYVNKVLYNYHVRAGSIMTVAVNEKHVLGHLYGMLDILSLPEPDNVSFKTARSIKLKKYTELIVKKILKGRIDMSDVNMDKNASDLLELIMSHYFIDIAYLIKKMPEIENYKNIIIYGAGEAAKELVWALDKAGIKISCAVVSSKKGGESLYGYNVFSLDELNAENDQTVFLCAVKRYFPEIKEKLTEKGYSNIIEATPHN